MITYLIEFYNSFEQIDYDNFISHLQFHQLTCSCGVRGSLTKHAYYFRTIKTGSSSYRLRILRVKCSVCGKTHAILPSFIVPYSQIPFIWHISIIYNYLEKVKNTSLFEQNSFISERDASYIYKNYKKFWHQRLQSISLSLSTDFDFISTCFQYFKFQFMQIRCTPNLLFVKPT